MNLIGNLDIRSPLIWVNSDEGFRVTDIITTHVADGGRCIYRMDGLRGLVVYTPSHRKWLQVRLPNLEGELEPCHSLDRAIWYVYELNQDVVFIVDYAHLAAPDRVPLFGEISRRYSQALREDSLDLIPLQFVLIAAVDKIPPELVRDLVQCEVTLPEADELAAIYTKVATGVGVEFDEISTQHIVRAGKGLSELEFTRACLASVHDTGTVDPEFVNRVKVDTIGKNGILEIRSPNISLDQIGGLDMAKDVAERIAWTWANPEEAKRWNVVPQRKILLVGVPGAGKSAWCEAIAHSLGHDLVKFGVSQALSKWVGESEQNMRNAFKQVRAMAPVTAWIDEFGRDMSGSGVSNDSGTTDRVHGEFLTGLQELPEDVFLVCAANRIDSLPPEMLRSGRFDIIMFVGFPTAEEREAIFRIHLANAADNFDLTALAKATALFTGAEIKALIEATRFAITPRKQRAITTEDLVAAAPKLKGRVWVNHNDQIIEMYRRAKAEWDWASSAQEAEADLILNATAAAMAQTPKVAAPKRLTPWN